MNHIVLIGRLTRDPEIRYMPSGTPICNFDLAVDRPKVEGKDQETDFIHIVTWQKQAEICANHLKKGRLVGVEGRLQIRNYETQEGQKRKVAEVVANFIQFLDKGDAKPQSKPANDTEKVNLDDLPF